jgi:RNA polymerase sigma-70 factor (ECF subfamily)
VAREEKIGSANRAQLMARAQEGDRESLHALLTEIAPIIGRSLRRRISDLAEVEDICQEALIAVYKSRHTFQPNRPFEPWLFAIVRRVTGEYLRRRRQHSGFEILIDEAPEMVTESSAGLGVGLRQAMEQLPPAQIEALELTKLLGLSVAEAARRAGTTVGSMKVRVHRGFESLKKSLLK